MMTVILDILQWVVIVFGALAALALVITLIALIVTAISAAWWAMSEWWGW